MNGPANTAPGRPDSAQQALPQHGFDAATPPLRNPAQQALPQHRLDAKTPTVRDPAQQTLPQHGADAEISTLSESVSPTLPWQQGWRYGLMGLPLAFVALPLYVLLPNFYARQFSVPLATLGLILLAVRLFDAVIDPLLGRWADGLHRPSGSRIGAARRTWADFFTPAPVSGLAGIGHPALRWAGLAALVLCLGFGLLFFPPAALQAQTSALLLWLAGALLLTTTAYSALSILHQAWGARLGGNPLYRSRVVAWREGLGLVGIVVASIAPVALGVPATTALFFVACLGGWLAWRQGPAPALSGRHCDDDAPTDTTAQPRQRSQTPAPIFAPTSDTGPSRAFAAPLWLPWQRTGFRRLMAVFMLNGIASAVPATLILFFVQDRLQAPASAEPLFLGSYFICAALSIPLWLKLVARIGLARTWAWGMGLSVAVFAFAAGLGTGDVAAFVAVCALSGLALGTDLALPAALLAGVIQSHGDQQQSEGAYFGWWAFASKLNLALAAGLALPALGWLGYTPGATDAQALQTLTLAYCVLPCVLKTGALLLLHTLIIRKIP